MPHEFDQRQIKAYLSAMRRLADPNRAVLANQESCVLVTAGTPLHERTLLTLVAASNLMDADLIHLEFEPGREASGPTNIFVAMMRDGIAHVGERCAVWADPRGRPFLARQSGNPGLLSFDPDGMDFKPGRPSTSMAKGLARGSAMLRQLVDIELARPAPANENTTASAAAA